jgi:hypothetical protein
VELRFQQSLESEIIINLKGKSMNIFDNTSASKTFPLASTILAAARDNTMSDAEVQHNCRSN